MSAKVAPPSRHVVASPRPGRPLEAVAEEYGASPAEARKMAMFVRGLVRKPPVTGGWTRQEVVGIAYALAEVNRKKDAPTVVHEVLVEAGITMRMLRAAKVDAFDLAELRKCFPRAAR